MKRVFLSTAGTSLYLRLTEAVKGHDKRLAQCFRNEDFPGLLDRLLELPPQSGLCGAEINAFDSLVKFHQMKNPPDEMRFFLMDSAAGRVTGPIFKLFGEKIGSSVEIHYLEEWQHRPRQTGFNQAMEQIAIAIEAITQKHQPNSIAFNVTGGHKILLLVATLIAQAKGIPTYHKVDFQRELLALPCLTRVGHEPNPATSAVEEFSLLDELEANLELTSPGALPGKLTVERAGLPERFDLLYTKQGHDHFTETYRLNSLGRLFGATKNY